MPGRKTDMADAAWLSELLEPGLLRGSFVPPPAIRQLRDLTRCRKRLIQAHTSECQRIQKTLEDAGIKLDSVASDVLGVSGRAMLRALADGQRDIDPAAQCWRLARRIDKKKAVVAVDHSILVICWHLLDGDCDYQNLGGDWFVHRNDRDRHKAHLVKQLQALGYSVTLQRAA